MLITSYCVLPRHLFALSHVYKMITGGWLLHRMVDCLSITAAPNKMRPTQLGASPCDKCEQPHSPVEKFILYINNISILQILNQSMLHSYLTLHTRKRKIQLIWEFKVLSACWITFSHCLPPFSTFLLLKKIRSAFKI